MRRPHRSVLTGALVAPVFGALALTGCGGSSGSSGPAAAGTPSTAVSASTAAPAVPSAVAPSGIAAAPSAPAATPGAARSASAALSAAERTFLAAVHSRKLTATAPTLNDTQVATLGRLTCALTAGGTLTAAQRSRVDTQVSALVQQATKGTPATAGEFLAVAKKDLCPAVTGVAAG